MHVLTDISITLASACVAYLLHRRTKQAAAAELVAALENQRLQYDQLATRSQVPVENASEGKDEASKPLVLLTEVLPQILWFNDPGGNVEFFNQRWYRYTGQAKDSALSWEGQPAIHPDDYSATMARWRDSLGTGEPYEAEFRLRSAEGIYHWHLARALPQRDPAGRVVRWFGSCTNVNEIKGAESQIRSLSNEMERKVAGRTNDLLAANDALLNARMRLQAVLDSATEVAIVVMDCRGVIQLFNRGAERMLQYQASDVVHLHTLNLFLPADEPERRAAELSAAVGCPVSGAAIFDSDYLPPHAYSLETVLLRSDGTPVVANMTATPMLDGYGRRIGTLGISVDITSRKRLESELQQLNTELLAKTADAEQANRAKSEFLATMSHEIRTPMNAILGMADLLWESTLDSSQRHYVQVFRRAGANLLNLVNEILDLSKIESGVFELEQIDFDLRELAARTVEMIQTKAQAKGIQLTLRIASETPDVLIGDPTRLQQILINLLGNAVKFTERGQISLTVTVAESDPGRVHFEVCDSGIGIPADKLESIFNDFTQAEKSTTRRFGGTGLGLGICRRLVNRMGGELNVRSKFGKGSCFYFDAALKENMRSGPRRPEAVKGLAGRRVLIVDSNATNRLIFAEMCASWGMETSECSHADQVLTGFLEPGASSKFDLLILDRLVPGLDGFELASHLRQSAITTPIMMIASDQVPRDDAKCQQLAISAYAIRPVRSADLQRLVCKSIGECENKDPESCADTVAGVKARILVAEDSEDNRCLFQAYFEGSEFQVDYVEDGEAAARMALTQTFDLILMDMQMPVMDGVAATRQIRQVERESGKPAVPVLALTANARQEDVEVSIQAGCTAHLSKPISKPKLLNAIREYILKS